MLVCENFRAFLDVLANLRLQLTLARVLNHLQPHARMFVRRIAFKQPHDRRHPTRTSRFALFPFVLVHVRAKSADKSFRSEEHTSELQSHSDLVCGLLLEKKK